MRIYFRHGLYRAGTDSANLPVIATKSVTGLILQTTNSPVVWSIAHYDKNYTVSEYQTVAIATSANMLTPFWSYVDLNPATGKKTYGLTTIAPTYGSSAPQKPVDQQIWFDTTNTVCKIYSATVKAWREAIRLVFGYWNGTGFESMPFGSGVGITAKNGVVSGTIIYDPAGKALRDSKGRFITTEDKMFSDSAATHEFSLENNITSAIANENIPAFHVVKWSDFNTVELASYSDTTDAVVAITLNSATKGNPVELCLEGKIVNDAWNWPTVNSSLWINTAGELSTVDPFDLRSYNKRKVQVARVLDKNTIVFSQGFGGQGEKGDAGDVSGIVNASSETIGVTKLSVDPELPSNPVAVGINDPILTAPRAPTAHQHAATSVTTATFGTYTGSDVQQALEFLYSNKLNLSGGDLTGRVTSTYEATDPTDLTRLADVTKQVNKAAVTFKKVDLTGTTESTLTMAFNALTAAARTLTLNQVLLIQYKDSNYVWAGGGVGVVTAANDQQFILVGKTSFTPPVVPATQVKVKTFSVSLIINQDPRT